MNDPWDVKSVRQPGQYVSCMKLNGVPLLPPVLSKECRKEMQYYRLLAKEVEKRINQLECIIQDSAEDSALDKTDAPELPQEYVLKTTSFVNDYVNKEETLQVLDRAKTPSPDLYDSFSTNTSHSWTTSNLELCLNEKENNYIATNLNNSPHHAIQPIEPPERDYNSTPRKNTPPILERERLIDLETTFNGKKPEREKIDLLHIEFDIRKIEPLLSDPLPDIPIVDGPPSLGSKSFTGSLNNIHSDCIKESSNLVRQSSYTVLNPSPQLLAHLKVQSLSTGIAVTSISMSESKSDLNGAKKRRSWDLESAKIKWSSMANELKQKTTANNKVTTVYKSSSKALVNKTQPISPLRSRSVQERHRRASLPAKSIPKSEPTQKLKKCPRPNTNNTNTNINQKSNQPSPAKKLVSESEEKSNQPSPVKKVISESEDPATKVKELYEKIQNQQLLQMATLVEKQKREQLLLQQVFDEQNSILYRQLKTICPKSPVEARPAWGDKLPQNDRGPVSLSQLINHKSPETDSPLSSTLTDTHNNLSKCAAVLKQSKDITGSLKKQRAKQTRRSPVSKSPEGNRTRTHSPRLTNTARKLSYDTTSSERENEQIMTDRTNDTLAGLNITFTSDSEDCPTLAPVSRPLEPREDTRQTQEGSVKQSVKTVSARRPAPARLPPTPQQLAAASVIVAYAKGYLVRRLLRTERVQATVQTIRDALLCALQLHQDRAGIRGADVDLHRRLIQQITAACYSLHDTFVASTPAERCALIAVDRERRQRPPAHYHRRKSDIMSQSHSGAFPARVARSPAHAQLMTRSSHETYSGTKVSARSYMPPPPRRAWR